MTRIFFLILCLGFVAACDSGGGDVLQAPTDEATDPDGGDGSDNGDSSDGDDDTPIESDRELPPGTESPTASNAIVRREPRDAGGNGYANSYRYNADDDTFFVDGLGFDGDQPDGQRYTRSTPFGNLGPYALYEAPPTFPDSVTGTQIPQFETRAIYGVSGSGETEFAIVRTGAYINYGFGGFIYQRNGEVTLPSEGQGTYSGPYAALRDFNGRGGLEYATGQATVDIDFSAFRGNCTPPECDNAVRGRITNRRIFLPDGTDITGDYLDALGVSNEATFQNMPVLTFFIGDGVADLNGENVGTLLSGSGDPGVDQTNNLPSGAYYAVMAGDHTSLPGGEIVGIIVTETDDPRQPGVTERETGGFIAVRQ
ncbi:hypothetical protein [uncultured Marivita sp.]|uniref:hypothetical protein n=1 Tax=uncultured Marivita sp. TaxID=888080 RepID=UPI0026065C24|nr:hypothetical protein [uncultured Marivita sp.]